MSDYPDSFPLQEWAGEFLTFLEGRELQLLSWGFYDIGQTAVEIEEAFENEASDDLREGFARLSNQGLTIRTVLQMLCQRRLLYSIPKQSESYRSRFAETVRLLAGLRQMFKVEDWATAPRLVTDIKLDVRRRSYPRRDKSAASILTSLSPLFPSQKRDLLEKCFIALSRGRDGIEYRFSGFQERAFKHIFSKYCGSGVSGSVVSTGTGSGKTKAFYIPALLGVISELNSEAFTKIIAIYPRNVLLSDQLREAIGEIEKLRPILTAKGIRSIRIGALLGSTPWNTWFDATKEESLRRPYYWKRRGPGHVIPHLKSPVDGLSDLIWRDIDRNAGRTCLYREGQEEPDVADGILIISREQLIQAPPDILFLSLEMLNREMGNPQWQKTFGFRQGKSHARLVLLDEVHSYEGINGAQASYVLRRWRHWAQTRDLHYVGLSATLRDAVQHLSAVSGVSPGQVCEFSPISGATPVGEMEYESAEYNLAIKGDPASGASLLATSIQAGMLLCRSLTPRTLQGSPPGEQIRPELLYGKKVFGFSDNLDSINRWYSDMHDAESNLRLARLRLPLHLRNPPAASISPAIEKRMHTEGQIWDMPVSLGYDLNMPLVVTRCSSQDPGADANSDLIIATSSLEVGYDDPEVGAILHHKRPISIASFVQRKGRAGRKRGSRPWTVLILSDYGADRWAFQSAERYFEPTLDSLFLPVANPYVVRVQAALFFVDWIGRRIGGVKSPFQYLSGRTTDQVSKKAQQQAAGIIREILDLGAAWHQFRGDLLRFFQLQGPVKDVDMVESYVNDILWQEPRSLVMEAFPALLRKIETNWEQKGKATDRYEDVGSGRPMPQSIPRATFYELDLKECLIALEPYRSLLREDESLPVGRFYLECCPGRVSKRFSTIQGEPGYWHSISSSMTSGRNSIDVQRLYSDRMLIGTLGATTIYQAIGTKLVHRPTAISDSSNSTWKWKVYAQYVGASERIPLLSISPWREVLTDASAYLHANNSWIEVVRYSTSYTFEIRDTKNKSSIRGETHLERNADDGQVYPEAIGFRLKVDGIRFEVKKEHLDACQFLTPEIITRFRVDYFLYCLKESEVMNQFANAFQIGWICEISMAMLTATALKHGISLEAAQERLTGNRRSSVEKVLDVIFQVRDVTQVGELRDQKLRGTLLDLWSISQVEEEIKAQERNLWAPIDDEFIRWAKRRYVATLAQAFRSAMCLLAEQVSTEDLCVDVLPEDESGNIAIIVTEGASGGLGQAEAVVYEIKQNPRRYCDAIEYSLSHCPQDDGIGEFLATAESAAKGSRYGGKLAEVFSIVREAGSFGELVNARDELRKALGDIGLMPRQRLVVSVMMKLLRPGSSSITDRLLYARNLAWEKHNRRIGLRIPARTYAYVCVKNSRMNGYLRSLFSSIGHGTIPTDTQLYAQVQQMLQSRCEDSCSDCLDDRNTFNDFGLPSRALARTWLLMEVEEVRLCGATSEWIELSRTILIRKGRVRLVAEQGQRHLLSEGILLLISRELDVEGLRMSVTIAGATRLAEQFLVTLHVQDFIYAA